MLIVYFDNFKKGNVVYTPHPDGHVDRFAPFGFRAPNQMTFKYASMNPNSRLGRVIRRIREHGPQTRGQLLYHVFGQSGLNRGWGSSFFSLMVKTKFLTMTRVGNTVTYDLGPQSKVVPNG